MQLVITMLPDGKVNIAGPLHDKLRCLGLIEIAKDLILKFDPKEAAQIVTPPPGLMDRLKP